MVKKSKSNRNCTARVYNEHDKPFQKPNGNSRPPYEQCAGERLYAITRSVTRIKHEQIKHCYRGKGSLTTISSGPPGVPIGTTSRRRDNDEQTAIITFGRRRRFGGPVMRAICRPAISTRRSTRIRSAGRTTHATTILSSSSSSRAFVVRPSSPRSPCPKPVATTSPSRCPTPGRAARPSAGLRRRFSDRRRSRTAARDCCCARSTVFRIFCNGADQKRSLVCSRRDAAGCRGTVVGPTGFLNGYFKEVRPCAFF